MDPAEFPSPKIVKPLFEATPLVISALDKIRTEGHETDTVILQETLAAGDSDATIHRPVDDPRAPSVTYNPVDHQARMDCIISPHDEQSSADAIHTDGESVSRTADSASMEVDAPEAPGRSTAKVPLTEVSINLRGATPLLLGTQVHPEQDRDDLCQQHALRDLDVTIDLAGSETASLTATDTPVEAPVMSSAVSTRSQDKDTDYDMEDTGNSLQLADAASFTIAAQKLAQNELELAQAIHDRNLAERRAADSAYELLKARLKVEAIIASRADP